MSIIPVTTVRAIWGKLIRMIILSMDFQFFSNIATIKNMLYIDLTPR